MSNFVYIIHDFLQIDKGKTPYLLLQEEKLIALFTYMIFIMSFNAVFIVTENNLQEMVD